MPNIDQLNFLPDWAFIILFSLFGGLGRTVTNYFFYIIADKGEDIALKKLEKTSKNPSKDLHDFSRLLNKGWTDDIVLIFLRAIPFIPGYPLSIICGILKINRSTFIFSTFIGSALRTFIYLQIGVLGISQSSPLYHQLNKLNLVGYLVIIALTLLIYFMYRRRKNSL